MVLGVTLFPQLLKAGQSTLPKTLAGSVRNFFSGTSGKIASTSLKVGGSVAGGGFLASLGLGALGDSFKGLAEKTGLDPSMIAIIIAVIAILFLFVVLKKK